MRKLTFVMTMLAVLVLASCSKKQGAALIPEDAVVVARIDLTQAMEKTGMKGDDTSIKDWVHDLVKEAGLDKETREKILDIVDDPTSSGIDFTEPVYLYMTIDDRGKEEVAVVGSVASKGDVTDLWNSLCDLDDDLVVEEHDEGDVQYVKLDRSTAFIYNGDWFYIGSVARDEDYEPDMDATIEPLLERAGGDGNIEGNKAFEMMCERKGMLQVGVFGSGIDAIKGSGEIASYLPEDLELKDIAIMADLAINDGEFVLTTEPLAVSDEWQQYIDKSMDELKDIDESQIKYASKDGFVAFAHVNVKNLYKRIYNYAKSFGMSSRELNELEQFKPVIDALDGTASIEIPEWIDENYPPVRAYVGTKSSALVDAIVGNIDGGVDSVGINQFRVPTDYDYDYDEYTDDFIMTPTRFMQVGWKNNNTYFLMNTDEAPFVTPSHKFPKDEVKGVGFYGRLNCKLVSSALMQSEPGDRALWKGLEQIFDYAEMYAENGGKLVMRLTTNKKDRSPIVAIVEYVKRNLR